MANLPWLDEVEKRLVGHGLPRGYVARFLEELTDHFHDLTEETMTTETDAYSRLGDPQQVAKGAIIAYRQRSFLGRHPMAAFLTFAVSPIVSVFVLPIALLFGMTTLLDTGLSGDDFGNFLRHLGPVGRAALPCVMSVLITVIPCTLGSIFYCKLAMRLGLGRKWALLSSRVLALIALTFVWKVRFSETPGESVLSCDVGIPQSIGHLPSFVGWYFIHPWQLVQFFVPLAIGWWFVRRKRDNGHLQVAS